MWQLHWKHCANVSIISDRLFPFIVKVKLLTLSFEVTVKLVTSYYIWQFLLLTDIAADYRKNLCSYTWGSLIKHIHATLYCMSFVCALTIYAWNYCNRIIAWKNDGQERLQWRCSLKMPGSCMWCSNPKLVPKNLALEHCWQKKNLQLATCL